MKEIKYFDHKNHRPLDLQTDGCNLSEWGKSGSDAAFAWHPKGFPVFLGAEEIAVSDEYAESDPYTVEQGIRSDFHTRRIEVTLDLINEALAGAAGCLQILDLGCGQGHITDRIRQSNPKAQISGLDYSISAIEYAHDHFGGGIEFAVGNAYDCPYASGFFDVVVCNNLWEHVPDPLHLLGRVRRSIKPGGYIIISTPSRYRISNLVRVLRGKPVIFMSEHHVTEYTVGQVKEQMKHGGFNVINVASRAISSGSVKANVAKSLCAKAIKIVGSHHQLESTVFYLAQREDSPMPAASWL